MQALGGGGRRDSTQKGRARHRDDAKRTTGDLDGWDRVSALGCEAKMLSADL